MTKISEQYPTIRSPLLPLHRDSSMRRLRAHTYPGNIRELENCIESAVVLCDEQNVLEKDLPLPRNDEVDNKGTLETSLLIGNPGYTLAQIEDAHIRGVLQACDSNQSEAARRLGIGRNTLARRTAAWSEGSNQ